VTLNVHGEISQQAMDTVWITETSTEDRERWLPNTGHFTF